MNEYSLFYIIVFMFIFSVFIVLKAYEHQLKLKQKQALKAYEHQLKLKQKQAALKQLLENDDAAIH